MAQAEGEVPTAPEADPPPVHPHSPRISERVRSIFRAGQRSRSRESNPDRIEVERSRSNSQAGGHEEEGYSSDEEESEEDCLYRTYTENDPVGQIMLNLAKDNMALLKKAGIKASHVNIKAMCRSFFLDRHRQPTVNSLVENSAKLVEKMILEKDLNTHKLNIGISPPSRFSPTPTLHTASARVEAAKHFPSRKEKFSGGKEGMSIVEFLSIANTAQNVLNMSEHKFLECLLGAVTGQAHSHMLSWIEQGEDVSSIYHLLCLHYDNRLTALDAKKQLNYYRIPKNSNLADGMAHILNLAARASTSVPAGPTRNALYNLEATQCILRALPPNSAATANMVYNQLCAKLERGANATELSRALNMHRGTIDSDIKQNGFSAGEKFNKGFGKANKSKGGVPAKVLTVTGTVDSATKPSPVPNAQNTGANAFSVDSKQGNKQNKQKNFKKNKNQGAKTRHWAQDGTNPNYCSLCGDYNHKAADGCPNMRDDNGKLIQVMPAHATCNDCPMMVQPRLAHPVMYCPFRPKGVFNRN